MKAIHKLFVDDRFDNLCAYCGGYGDTRDHVPSKTLLNLPMPENLPVVPACKACNLGFSLDEEYFACFIDCVLAGNTSFDSSISEKTRKSFEHNPFLQNKIEQTRIQEGEQTLWNVDHDRARSVILKLARGHAMFENGEPLTDQPASVKFMPLSLLTKDELSRFESVRKKSSLFHEIGSRGFIREVESGDKEWLTVQPGMYRYMAFHINGGFMVQIVIREYLACEVVWE